MDNKTIVREVLENTWQKRDLSQLSKYVADNAVAHDPMVPTKNLKELKALFEGHLKSFSNFQVDIAEQIAERDLVCTRATLTATDTGGFMGRPPTGRRLPVKLISIDRIKDGKIVETWIQIDYLGLVQGLGIIPTLQAPTNGRMQVAHAK
jgi:predicted ester cyclase